MYIHVYTYMYVCMYVCMYVYIYIYICICIYTYAYTHIHNYTYTYTYAYTYTDTYTYTYRYRAECGAVKRASRCMEATVTGERPEWSKEDNITHRIQNRKKAVNKSLINRKRGIPIIVRVCWLRRHDLAQS